MIGAHPFCYPMIARWLIGLMVEEDYSLAARSYVPDISVSSSCEQRDLGLAGCLKEIICIICIRLVK